MPPAAPSWERDRRFAVVVDAGSSGSRLQVYSWRDVRMQRSELARSGRPARVLPAVEKGTPPGSGQAWQLKVEPGLSTLGETPDRVDAYLGPLFVHAQAVVPRAELARTPVYVLATAGLRLLPDWQREALLARTCTYLIHHTPFHVGSSQAACRQHVQVITGEQEGLLGWITANYLMDGFRFPARANDPVAAAQPQSKYGFLDMGGASTQIAFEPSAAALAQGRGAQGGSGSGTGTPEDELTTINLRLLDGTDASPNVFVTTFLGFGTNQARARYAETLLSPTATTVLPDPCIPRGLDDPQGGTSTVLRGTGSFDQCLEVLKPLLRKEAACARPPCLFHGVHVPPIDFSVNHFIGVSEYWYSSHDIFRLGGVYDWAGFQRAADEYCSTPWSTLLSNYEQGKYASTVDESRVKMQCFKAAWMTTVLHEGIGLPRYVGTNGSVDGSSHVMHATQAQGKAEDKNLLFQSVNDVHGLAVSWTLGKAVLEAAGSIPPAPGALSDAPIDVAGQVGDNAPGLGNWIPFWNYLTNKNRRPKPKPVPAAEPPPVLAHEPTPAQNLAPTPISTVVHQHVSTSTVTVHGAAPAAVLEPVARIPWAVSNNLLGLFAVALMVLLVLGWKVLRMRPSSRRHLIHNRLGQYLPWCIRRRWGRGSALSRGRGSPRLVSTPLTGSGRATPTPFLGWTSARPETPPTTDDESKLGTVGTGIGTSTSRPSLLGGVVLRSGPATPTPSRPPSRGAGLVPPPLAPLTPYSPGSAPGLGIGTATDAAAADHRMREEYARAHYAREHRLDPHPPPASGPPTTIPSTTSSSSSTGDVIPLQPYNPAGGRRYRPPGIQSDDR